MLEKINEDTYRIKLPEAKHIHGDEEKANLKISSPQYKEDDVEWGAHTVGLLGTYVSSFVGSTLCALDFSFLELFFV